MPKSSFHSFVYSGALHLHMNSVLWKKLMKSFTFYLIFFVHLQGLNLISFLSLPQMDECKQVFSISNPFTLYGHGNKIYLANSFHSLEKGKDC